MEEVNITELESRYFSDLFACCDIEKTGKVPVLKATEMFRSSNISDDILKNVCFYSFNRICTKQFCWLCEEHGNEINTKTIWKVQSTIPNGLIHLHF